MHLTVNFTHRLVPHTISTSPRLGLTGTTGKKETTRFAQVREPKVRLSPFLARKCAQVEMFVKIQILSMQEHRHGVLEVSKNQDGASGCGR